MSRTAFGPRNQRGASLIEVMVTGLILSVGLLGTASLQLVSLRTHQGAAQRTQATHLAYTLADLARANRSAVLAGAVDDDVVDTWIAHSDDVLVGADVDFTVVDANNGVVRITVSWMDDRTKTQADEIAASFQVTTRI